MNINQGLKPIRSASRRLNIFFNLATTWFMRSRRSSQCSQRLLRVHIGHHFWGCGNAGDDFTLAGYLIEIQRSCAAIQLTCCSIGDLSILKRQFPEVTWLPYTLRNRIAAIFDCDTWLGLGGTPFQSDAGAWMESHLDDERRLCKAIGRSMHFLGVGVGDKEALLRPKFRQIVEEAAHVWTRDAFSKAEIEKVRMGITSQGADLANLIFMECAESIPNHSLGFLLHFESLSMEQFGKFNRWLQQTQATGSAWVIQEMRRLEWSERVLYEMLSPEARRQMALLEPPLTAQNTFEILKGWSLPKVLCSSRYHGALFAAWQGRRVIIVCRNDKLRGLAIALDLPYVDNLEQLMNFMNQRSIPKKVDREKLVGLAQAAATSVHEWLDQAKLFKAAKTGEN